VKQKRVREAWSRPAVMEASLCKSSSPAVTDLPTHLQQLLLRSELRLRSGRRWVSARAASLLRAALLLDFIHRRYVSLLNIAGADEGLSGWRLCCCLPCCKQRLTGR
jgi:hypothetical protein